MTEGLPLRKELKEMFIQDLSHAEKLFFLRKAREAITGKGYRASEDLFHYCYFSALKERMRSLGAQGAGGLERFLLVEGMKDLEGAIGLYEERLEKGKLSAPDKRGPDFIEFFSP